MKRARFAALAAVSIMMNVICSAQERKIVPIPFADPFVFFEDGTYYMYGTCAEDGIAVVVSDDMKTWRSPDGKQMHLALSKEDSYGEFFFWAPEVYHVGDFYYMYYSAEEHICAARSDSPLGPFVQETKAPMLPEKNIDNSLFIDDDGTPYLFWVHFGDGLQIWSARLEDDLMTIRKGTERFCTKMSQKWEMEWPSVNEGPFVVKRKGQYYLTYSANSYESTNYGIGFATTDRIGGEWKKYEGNPVLQQPRGLLGVGHHSFFRDRHGRDRIAFHSHNGEGKIHPRVIHISRWKIDRKGILRISEKDIFTPFMETE